MEENTKQTALDFKKGLTNVPSDILCDDDCLSESVGLVFEDGEHRVIQSPVVRSVMKHDDPLYNGMIDGELLYIHRFNGEERYIYKHVFNSADHRLPEIYFCMRGFITGTAVGAYYQDATNITSIGKTLIVSNSEGLHYFLWDNDGGSHAYKYLAPISSLSLEVDFYMSIFENVDSSARVDGILQIDEGIVFYKMEKDKQNEWNDLTVGLYEKNKKRLHQKKCFIEPFFVRAAFELYDGTYTCITQPILLFPSVTRNTNRRGQDGECSIVYRTYGHRLVYEQDKDYTEYSDIIKGVVIFASKEIPLYDTSVDQPCGLSTSYLFADSICNYNGVTFKKIEDTIVQWDVLQMRDVSEIINDIKSTSVFYKLCSLGLQKSRNYIDDKIDTHLLENLTTQDRITEDDYYSRNALVAKTIYEYNARLNLSNVKRGFFEGYGNFLPYDNSSAAQYTFYVRIKTDSGSRVVKHVETTRQKQGIYFFYPDARADWVTIYKGNTIVLNHELTEHRGLNGAYYFRGLPTESENEAAVSSTNALSGDGDTTPEVLDNYILTSEVNNPFVFKAKGYTRVGNGSVIGMSTITQALSQGQFGQYPLLVFTTEGIWALSVSSGGSGLDAGYYTSVHPMSREVCNNVRSITQTDGAVFFTSEKGLMMIVGNNVKCVSEQMSGKTDAFVAGIDTTGGNEINDFNEILKNCFIAYDYRDSLLWILNGDTSGSVCYIYSIKSGTFTKYNFGNLKIMKAVNDYPDYLLQQSLNSGGESYLYSLLDRPNINLDDGTYSARLISRPIRFGNVLTLKSIRQIKHLLQEEGAKLDFGLFASNDCKQWVFLRSLKGKPWKYYRFAYDFKELKATDRFSGTVCITQERRTDKLR